MTPQRLFAIVVLILFALPTAGVTQNTAAPDRRAQRHERSVWKRTAREYVRNPTALKAREQAFQDQIRDAQGEALRQQSQTQLRSIELANAQDSLQACIRGQSLATVESRPLPEPATTTTTTTTPTEDPMQGLVYRVQVGAYERLGIANHASSDPAYNVEQQGRVKKYQLGYFRSSNDARLFRDDLRKLGLRDAFVVAFKDGRRIEIREALQLENQPRR
jgi:hypothetical protein